MSTPAYYLVIVGTVDNPVYDSPLNSAKAAQTNLPSHDQPAGSFSIFGSSNTVGYSSSGTKPDAVLQLIAHASLDVVDDLLWTNSPMSVPASVKLRKTRR